MWLYMKAIRRSPLSLTLPYLAFTPVFNTVTGYVLLGETVTLQGFSGIALVVSGAQLIVWPASTVRVAGRNALSTIDTLDGPAAPAAGGDSNTTSYVSPDTPSQIFRAVGVIVTPAMSLSAICTLTFGPAKPE